jgi:signal transduction histidine kinase
MDTPRELPTLEIERLQRSMNDLVSLLALPAMWAGADPPQIARGLLDALLAVLCADFIYVRLNEPDGKEPIEMARTAHQAIQPREVGETLDRSLHDVLPNWPMRLDMQIGKTTFFAVPARLGLQSEIGVVVVGSVRADFPTEIERLLLSVASNEATISLRETRLLSEQKRLARELDRRVAERTRELSLANQALVREIAERRRAQEALQRSEAFLAEGQQLARTGNFSWHVATGDINWSEQLYRMFEFTPGTKVTFDEIANRVHPDDAPILADLLKGAQHGAHNFQYQHRIILPDRSVRYLHIVAHRVAKDHGEVEYIGAVQDITERRLADKALGEARSELAHVARVASLGALTASIAHEVNQPLSGIITNASTCLRMLAANPPNVEGALETTRRTIRDGNRAADIIARLRTLFTKRAAVIEPVDLNGAAREVIELLRSDLERNRVILRVEFADELPPVGGDRIQLQQVIMNLLRNAAEAMSSVGDRPRRLVIATAAAEEAECVRLTVQDTGTGFGLQTPEQLFEAFYSTKTDGMGIGLSICRSIIEGHNGRLWAAANDGPGATFAFSIPRCAGGGDDLIVDGAVPSTTIERS